MTTYQRGPLDVDPDPEPQKKDTAIPPTDTDPAPGQAPPLDDMAVPPLTEPSDTNGG